MCEVTSQYFSLDLLYKPENFIGISTSEKNYHHVENYDNSSRVFEIAADV